MAPFKTGDVVVHARRPEWGEGVVDQATAITHEGSSAQRLGVRFANHGRVVLNTAIAQILQKGSERPMSSSHRDGSTISSPAGQGWLASLEQEGTPHELWALPEALTDLFSNFSDRLRATLESYRFNPDARGLIDWAVVQTGLDDPLSKYNRHEMEQAFARFARDRDRHLVELVRTIKRKGAGNVIDEQLRQAPSPEARKALAKAVRA